jgi:hypothetical protein
MRIARLVTDFLSGRRYRLTNEDKNMRHANYAFNAATPDLESLRTIAKSRRAQSVREMSDDKDYMEEDIDEFDRAPQGARRRDMRDADDRWRGIQALDEDAFNDYLEMDADLIHEMLVSGRPARIRFPGARGDSELEPVSYVHRDGVDEDELDEGRSTIGGDRLARRSVRRGLDRDEYVDAKSFRGRGLDPRALIKGSRQYDMIKSRLQDAVCAEDLDPSVLLVLDSVDPRFASSARNVERALAAVPREVARRYNIPMLPHSPFAHRYDD